MANIQAPLKYTVDLDQGAVQAILEKPLATLDSLAHVFSVAVTQGKANVDLTGATCTGYFIRSDKVTIPIDGTVSGNVASVTLLPNCYAVSGRFFLHVKLNSGSVVHSILRVEGSVQTSRTDAMASGGGAAQSFDEMVAAVTHVDAEMKKRDRVRNLLDNSDFRAGHFIAQAGQNAFHGTAKYVGDRWISWNADATFTDEYITPGTPIDQRVSRSVIDLTKTYTAVICYADGTIKADSGNFTNAFGSYNLGIYCMAADTSLSYVSVRLNQGVNIRWVALYEGAYTADTLPTYQPKGYAAELAECQRYYRPFIQVAPAVAVSQTHIQAEMVLEPPMRITPTVVINGHGNAFTVDGEKTIRGSYSATNTADRVGYVFYTESVTQGTPAVVMWIDGYLTADL